MALILQSSVTISESSASRWSASDLQSLRNGVSWVTLKDLARGHMRMKRRDFSVSAKLRKGKKPSPQDSDSSSQPSNKKPVTLDFEKPLVQQRNEIIKLQKMSNKTGLDHVEEIIALEEKYQKTLTELYTHLTPEQRVAIARHPYRPTCLDHIRNITKTFVPLEEGADKDDQSVVTGMGMINNRWFMFIGYQKDRNTKDKRDTSNSYRKVLEIMKYAESRGFPIVTLIDNVDMDEAFDDIIPEKPTRGEVMGFLGLSVPLISIVIGQVGNGTFAIACADKLLMLENSVLYVESPEPAPLILIKPAKGVRKPAKKLGISAPKMSKMQLCDGIIPEALGGAHTDPMWTSEQIKAAILESLAELEKMGTEKLINLRHRKFANLTGFQGIPTVPPKAKNVVTEMVPNKVLEVEVEKSRDQIVEGKKSSRFPSLKTRAEELDREIFMIIQDVIKSSPDLRNKAMMLRGEVMKGTMSGDEESKAKIEALEKEIQLGVGKILMTSAMKEKYEGLMAELKEITKESNRGLTKESEPIEITLESNVGLTKEPEVKEVTPESNGGLTEEPEVNEITQEANGGSSEETNVGLTMEPELNEISHEPNEGLTKEPELEEIAQQSKGGLTEELELEEITQESNIGLTEEPKLIEIMTEEPELEEITRESNGGSTEELALEEITQEPNGGLTEEPELEEIMQESKGGLTKEPELIESTQESNGGLTEEPELIEITQESNGDLTEELELEETEEPDLEGIPQDSNGGSTEEPELNEITQKSNGGLTEEPELEEITQESNGGLTTEPDLEGSLRNQTEV